jgi:hypothetical protein
MNSVFDMERASQDSRSAKKPKENVHQAETAHLTEALDHETAGEYAPALELEPEESNAEEPEFAGASED